ncbi:DUF4328 domain-containing protein [Streptomyces longispororuber]|uniref:DUF4328 domain-containing protein n=1 Tax=Streptomyces longispororuber TaxID=68230 RepID=UPI003402E695
MAVPCAECQARDATTAEGLCGLCVTVAADAAPRRVVAGPRPGDRLRSPVAPGRAAMVLLGAVAATDLWALWAGLGQRRILDRLLAGEYGEAFQREVEDADSRYALAGGAQLVACVLTAVVFLYWFRLVRVNAELFVPEAHTKGRGWALGGWFVPVVNLWVPRRVTSDIWDASVPGPEVAGRLAPVGWDPREPRPAHALISAWWTLWIVGFFVGRTAGRVYSGAETASEYATGLRWMMIADALDVVAAVLAVAVVYRITTMQDTKARAHAAAGWPAGGPVSGAGPAFEHQAGRAT